ncbi:MAG: polysaccharide biosynthesis/export family protein [Paludibacteraceae bacterium]|nr:polysaccharide biosynthesis/export family protein [Paludibacteraceae bacterium]
MKQKHIFETKWVRWMSLMVLSLVALLSSCQSHKEIAYLQDQEGAVRTAMDSLYDARIKPKDLLTITVNTFDKEASLPFNLMYPASSPNGYSNNIGENAMQKYLVDNDGSIDFPVLGRIKVSGLTKKEVEAYLRGRLSLYLKDEPLVNVRMVNYKISVIGEVARPNTYTITNEKVNILEALALAGDLTIYGKRKNVKLMRESETGERGVYVVDLTDRNLINSPYFYLQQNDVLYVEPNRTKMRNSRYSALTGQILTGTSVVVSVASLIATLTIKKK